MPQPQFNFLVTEKKIAERVPTLPAVPIRVFDLAGLGFDLAEFCRVFAPTFYDLAWDYYDVRLRQIKFLQAAFPEDALHLGELLPRYYAGETAPGVINDFLDRFSLEQRAQFEAIRPYRQRSVAALELTLRPGGYDIVRLPTPSYTQNVAADDYRSVRRVFQETSVEVTAHPFFVTLVTAFGNCIREFKPGFKKLRLNFHQISVVARTDAYGEGAPEGIHQDGAEYIVSALVVERSHVLGAESIVFGSDQKTHYLHTTLLPGQGLFQADQGSSLWHTVTPLRLDPTGGATLGRRSIFGFDTEAIA